MKVAALDLGSNSFLCLIVEGNASGIQRVLSDQVKVVRLGQGVNQTKMLHPDALQRAKECLTDFKKEIDRHKVDRVLAMATSAARDATNRDELFKIGADLGIPIEIIPGKDEARITFAGATEGVFKSDTDNVVVIDVGGGSTEFILGNQKKLHFSKSLNIGGVRLTEKFISHQPVPLADRQAMEEFVDEQIRTIIANIGALPAKEILAVAGTPSALAAAELGGFDAEKVHGFILTRELLKKWCDLLASTSTEEKISKYKLEPGRADILFVGATILYRFLIQSGKPSMMVSIKGVRYGVALEALSRP